MRRPQNSTLHAGAAFRADCIGQSSPDEGPSGLSEKLDKANTPLVVVSPRSAKGMIPAAPIPSFRGLWKSTMPDNRRFPPPWRADDDGACFIIRDRNKQALAYINYENDPGRRTAAGLLTAMRLGGSRSISRGCRTCCSAGPAQRTVPTTAAGTEKSNHLFKGERGLPSPLRLAHRMASCSLRQSP